MPTPKQVRFMLAAADPTLRSMDAMAKQAHVNRVTVWRWSQDPRFATWLRDELQRTYGLKYAMALHKALDLAIAGSPEHLKLLMMKFGDLRQAADSSNAGNGLQQTVVCINVPRPDRDAPQLTAAIDVVSVSPMPQPRSDAEH